MIPFSRRGQLNVFLILGIIIFTATLVGYAATKLIFKDQAGERAAVDAIPVRAHIEQCMRGIGKEAIVQIGLNGGYVNVSDPRYTQGAVFNRLDARPYNADGVAFAGRFYPYWWHVGTATPCVSCSIDSFMPNETIIQEQIATYVERNIARCVDFRSLNITYDSVSAGTPRASVSLLPDDIEIRLSYPLTLTIKTQQFTVDAYQARVGYGFKSIYDVAADLFAGEATDLYLERATRHVISMYSGISFTNLPPIAGATANAYALTWSLPAVRQNLGNILFSTIPLITFNNTLDAGPPDPMLAPFRSNALNRSVNMSVHVLVPTRPDQYYLDIHPRIGNRIQPNVDVTNMAFPFNTILYYNNYRFFYDISFPVIMVIHDPNAFNGEGYTFMFSMESFLMGNRNVLEWYQGNGTVTIDLSGIGPNQSTGNFTPNTRYCDSRQLISEDFTFNATDWVTGDMLDQVSVFYRCGNYAKCYLGATNANDGYLLTTKLPICLNGRVTLEREGYKLRGIPVDTTDLAAPQHITERLYPYKNFNVSVSKRLLGNRGHNISGESFGVTENESVGIFIFSQEEDQDGVIVMVNDRGRNATQIRLAPGVYSAESIFITNETVNISRECKHLCDCVDPLSEDFCYGRKRAPPGVSAVCTVDMWIPEQNDTIMNESVAGGMSLNNYTGFWNVPESIYQMSELNMTVLRLGTPTCIDGEDPWAYRVNTANKTCSRSVPLLGCVEWEVPDLNFGLDEQNSLENFSKQYRAELEPVFS